MLLSSISCQIPLGSQASNLTSQLSTLIWPFGAAILILVMAMFRLGASMVSLTSDTAYVLAGRELLETILTRAVPVLRTVEVCLKVYVFFVSLTGQSLL